MKLDRRWLFFQVAIPLAAPALLAATFVGAWRTLDLKFVPNMGVIFDLTPWAIVIYSLTLIGGTFDRSWEKLDKGSLSALWGAVAANAAYYALLVIRRHDTTFHPPSDAYYVTVVLMVGSIIICYRAR